MQDASPQGNRHRGRRALVVLSMVGAAIWLQRGYVSEIPPAIEAITRSAGGWVAVAVLASAVTYLMAAVAMIGTVHRELPFRRVLQVQVASGLTTLAAPAGIGGAGLNIWFLERVGVARREAFAAALRNGVVGGLVHIAGLTVVVVKLPELIAVDTLQIRDLATRSIPAVGVILLLLAGLAWWQRERARHALRTGREGWDTTLALFRRPARALPLVGGSIGLSLSYGVTFWASARAVGVPLSLPTAIAIELVVEAVGNMSATPGGVGVVEAASLQALLLVGAQPTGAVAVVLLHRLLTFWLPALPGALALRGLQGTSTSERVGPPRHPQRPDMRALSHTTAVSESSSVSTRLAAAGR